MTRLTLFTQYRFKMEDALTPRQMKAAQRTFYLFSLLNVISFQLLSGNIITLYALRLGATNFLVGLLYSFVPLAQLLPFVGRIVVRRFGSVRTMGIFWIARYLLMIPILFAPIFASTGRSHIGVLLIVISVIGFNLARGIGITGHNPVIGGITTEQERGAFLANNQLIIHSGAILTGVVMALLLGRESSLLLYTALIFTGILSGLLASMTAFRLPEPPESQGSAVPGFVSSLKDAWQRRGFPRFVFLLTFMSFVIAMITPFLVVYMKRVYDQGDNTVIFFTVMGSVGAIVMALISGFMIDRMGAKPLISLFSGIVTLTLIPLAVAPSLSNPLLLWLFAGLIFFFLTMGTAGVANAANTYFFAFITPEERLNLGVVYFLSTGSSAMTGSLFGGALLDWMQSGTELSTADAFRLYFGLSVAAFVVLLLLISNLERLGAYSIRNVLNLFISPRDLRALSLLHRLKGTTSATEQRNVIRALGDTQSEISIRDLLQELRSPRFSVRTEALNALSQVKPNEEVRDALIQEVEKRRFTTAYLAAEIIGKHRVQEGIEALRRSLGSKDFFLIGKSMVSLALLNDRESIPAIERIFEKTRNPRLLIHGATALEIYKSPTSIAVLLKTLEKRTSLLVRDEIILAISGILRIQEFFYPLYLSYINDKSDGMARLLDSIDELMVKQPKLLVPEDQLRNIARSQGLGVKRGVQRFSKEVSSIFGALKISIDGKNWGPSLREAALNANLTRLRRFRFLLTAVAIRFAISTDGSTSNSG